VTDADDANWGRSRHTAAAAEGKPIVTVSAWSFYFAQVANIYLEAGYRLAHLTHHMDGDRSYTQGIVYDAVFEKRDIDDGKRVKQSEPPDPEPRQVTCPKPTAG